MELLKTCDTRIETLAVMSWLAAEECGVIQVRGESRLPERD